MTRDRMIIARVTHEQYARLQTHAKNAGYRTLSAWVRARLLLPAGSTPPEILTRLAHLRAELAGKAPLQALQLDEILAALA